jgi:hypothetical protein
MEARVGIELVGAIDAAQLIDFTKQQNRAIP